MVAPILLYCSEVFGVYDTSVIEIMHMKFSKKILGVKIQTPNMAVLGETGRYPFTLLCKERALKYWIKILSNPNSIMHSVFQMQCNDTDNSRCNYWAKQIKIILDDLGYSYLWNNFSPMICNYLPQLQQRLRDQFCQKWDHSISEMPKLHYYAKFKKDFKYENIWILLRMIILESCLPVSGYLLIVYPLKLGVIQEF